MLGTALAQCHTQLPQLAALLLQGLERCPSALAGVGLFMLFRGSDRDTDVEYDYGSGAGYNYNRGRYDTLESSRGYRPDRGQYWEEADDRGGIREKMSDVGERVSDAAATVKDKTSDLKSPVKVRK